MMDSEGLLKKIGIEADVRQQELMELIKKLVSFPTVSPPARNTQDIQQFIKEYLEDLGFTIDKWDVYPGDPNVVGILEGKTSDHFNSLIINGHDDVAEVGDESAWTHFLLMHM